MFRAQIVEFEGEYCCCLQSFRYKSFNRSMLLAFRSVFRSKNYFSTMSVSALDNVAGICQMRSTNDKKFNRDQVSELVKRAEGKSSFLFFPECVDYVGINADETIAMAEPINGQTVQFYKDLWYFLIISLRNRVFDELF